MTSDDSALTGDASNVSLDLADDTESEEAAQTDTSNGALSEGWPLRLAVDGAWLSSVRDLVAACSLNEVIQFEPAADSWHRSSPEHEQLARISALPQGEVAGILDALVRSRLGHLEALRRVGHLELALAALRQEFLDANQALLTIGEFLDTSAQTPHPEPVVVEFKLDPSGTAHEEDAIALRTDVDTRAWALAGLALPTVLAKAALRISLRGVESGLLMGTWEVQSEEGQGTHTLSLGRALTSKDTKIELRIAPIRGDDHETSRLLSGLVDLPLDMAIFRWPAGMHLTTGWGKAVSSAVPVNPLLPAGTFIIRTTLRTVSFVSVERESRTQHRGNYSTSRLAHSFSLEGARDVLQLHPPLRGFGIAVVSGERPRSEVVQLLGFMAHAQGPATRVSVHACSAALGHALLDAGSKVRAKELDQILQEHEASPAVGGDGPQESKLEVELSEKLPVMLVVASLVSPGDNSFAWLRVKALGLGDYL